MSGSQLYTSHLQHQLGESFPASDLKVKPHIHIRTEPLPNIRAWQQAGVTIPCPYAGDAGQCGHQAAQVQGAGARPEPGDQRRHHTRHHRQAAVRAGGMSGALVCRAPLVPDVSLRGPGSSLSVRAMQLYQTGVASVSVSVQCTVESSWPECGQK